MSHRSNWLNSALVTPHSCCVSRNDWGLIGVARRRCWWTENKSSHPRPCALSMSWGGEPNLLRPMFLIGSRDRLRKIATQSLPTFSCTISPSHNFPFSCLRSRGKLEYSSPSNRAVGTVRFGVVDCSGLSGATRSLAMMPLLASAQDLLTMNYQIYGRRSLMKHRPPPMEAGHSRSVRQTFPAISLLRSADRGHS